MATVSARAALPFKGGRGGGERRIKKIPQSRSAGVRVAGNSVLVMYDSMYKCGETVAYPTFSLNNVRSSGFKMRNANKQSHKAKNMVSK